MPTTVPSVLTPKIATSSQAIKPESILEILIKNSQLTKEQADLISVEKISTGKTEEQLLVEKKLVSEEVLVRAKAEFYSIPFVRISETGINPEALNLLSESVARRYSMLPFAYDKEELTLSVAMENPLDLSAIDFAQQTSGYRIIAHFAMTSELERSLSERYAQTLSGEVTRALEETGQMAQQKIEQEDLSQLSGEVIRQAPISKIVETILSFAIKARASDVHIEPHPERTRVRYRIDGILSEKLILPKSVHNAVISRIKILSHLKIDERRLPQDGRFDFSSEGHDIDLRISTLPTIHGEKVVMRLLKKEATVPSLEELGLDGVNLRHLKDAIKVPHGIILITGPTGSGKTTTLYSLLDQINTPKVNILTLEDPIEYQMTGVNQVNVNPQAGLTFASGLRSFLRQDPNIIMVGEIRDNETVELAVQASLTGHLVFSTLHTSSAAGALPRLLDMDAEPFLLASTMQLVVAQRVVRRINEKHKEEYQPEQEVIDGVKNALGPLYDLWCQNNNKDPNKLTLFRAKSDLPLTETEYKGRIGIFEVMIITEEIKSLILKRTSASEIEKVAIQGGMVLMKQDGYIKALSGVTTLEEVLRVAEI